MTELQRTAVPTSGPDARGKRRWPRTAALALLVALGGAVAGVTLALATPAHAEIAGSDTRVWLELGRQYDQFGVQGVVTLKRATERSVLGESLGVRAVPQLDASQLVDAKGQFEPDILPAYIQAYSDPEQLVSDIRDALVAHLVRFAAIGAAIALFATAAGYGYRAWRRSYDRAHWSSPEQRDLARSYRTPERTVARHAATILVVVVTIAAIPSGRRRHAPTRPALRAEQIFAGGPLAGVEVDGLLRPALIAAEDYIRTYFSQTDTYYDQLRKKLLGLLAESPVQLPAGDDLVHLGYVTDRHCNIGMDRVDVALLRQLGVTTLVSGGDDAFSGTFAFESACTRNLAEQSRRAGIIDVFAAGNHDSPKTVAAEAEQGIKTLNGAVVTVDGLDFLGSPDPRTSRYGQGIRPSSDAAQHAVVDAQGTAIGRTACAADGPIIAVLHDPRAGAAALKDGCGKVTLALDGHTHTQAGPDAVALPGGFGYQFVGASAGGAPGEKAVEGTFGSRLTVGPLHHEASVYIVSVERATGRLAAVTAFRFSQDQQITVDQQLVG